MRRLLAKKKAKKAVERMNRICERLAKEVEKKHPYFDEEAKKEIQSLVEGIDVRRLLGF